MRLAILEKYALIQVKGKLLTSWSLIWLVATVLFVAGGALNLSQRSFQKLPPTDGAEWIQKESRIFAEKD